MNRFKLASIFGGVIFTLSLTTFGLPLDEWKNTRLEFKTFAQEITSEKCYENVERFTACMSAISEVVHAANKGSVLVGPIDLLGNNESTTWSQIYLEREHSRNFWRPEFWLRLLKIRDYEIQFQDLMTSVARLADKKNESGLAAIGLNTLFLFSNDPHTHIIPKSQFQKQANGSDAFVGVGVSMTRSNGKLIVARVFHGTPAWASGLKAFDEILEIDHTVVSSDNFEESLSRIRGPEGTQLSLKVLRGNETIKVRVRRQTILLPNVTSRTLEDRNNTWGYISIESFSPEETCKSVESHLGHLLQKQIQGLLLDLRYNSGGLVSQGICVANLFLPKGRVVVRARTGSIEKVERTRFEGDTSLPLVILVNHETASAAEIVAGALQDHGRALVTGTRSFGKGSFQQGEALPGNARILFFHTIAQYFLPSGRSPQFFGIVPDFVRYRLMHPRDEELSAQREAELFGRGILNSTQFTQRPRVVSESLSRCLSETALAEGRLESGALLDFLDDYQVLSAQDQMTCLNQGRLARRLLPKSLAFRN